MDQLVPFHCSARVCSVVPLLADPTAEQSEALTQLTPSRLLPWAALVLGLGAIDQPAPFHCSVRVWAAVPLLAVPTAQQVEPLPQLTLLSSLFRAALVFGLGTIDQLVPFHCSVRVWAAVPLLAVPTAQQVEALTQLTLLSSLFRAALVF